MKNPTTWNDFRMSERQKKISRRQLMCKFSDCQNTDKLSKVEKTVIQELSDATKQRSICILGVLEASKQKLG